MTLNCRNKVLKIIQHQQLQTDSQTEDSWMTLRKYVVWILTHLKLQLMSRTVMCYVLIQTVFQELKYKQVLKSSST